ncbi:MAG: hypothetical protein ACKORA_07465, partial [Solirubrobacterales bacterium]
MDDDFFNPDTGETDPGSRETATTVSPASTRERGRKPRPVMSPTERRQLLIRRAIAVGIGVVVFILIVLGIRSCLDARSNRALEDYASNVTQLTDETNALGETTFETIDDPGDLSITDFTDEIETDKNAMDG